MVSPEDAAIGARERRERRRGAEAGDVAGDRDDRRRVGAADLEVSVLLSSHNRPCRWRGR